MDKLLGRTEAAEYLGIAKATLDQYAREGKIKRHYIGRLPRFRKSDLDKLISDRGGETR